jgi:hypothetical protein
MCFDLRGHHANQCGLSLCGSCTRHRSAARATVCSLDMQRRTYRTDSEFGFSVHLQHSKTQCMGADTHRYAVRRTSDRCVPPAAG